MKLKRNISAVSIFLYLLSGKQAAAQQQTIELSNLDWQKGELLIAWYDQAAGFRDPQKAVYRKVVAVSLLNTIEVAFDSIKNGKYAIAVFLDRNGNRKLDTNIMGIPKEKYGFSNNVYPMMRAASFEEAAISVTENSGKIRIRMK